LLKWEIISGNDSFQPRANRSVKTAEEYRKSFNYSHVTKN